MDIIMTTTLDSKYLGPNSEDKEFADLSARVMECVKDTKLSSPTQENRALLQACFSFLDKSLSLCIVLNSLAEILFMNQHACEQLSVNYEDYYGKCWLTEFLLPEQRTEIILVFEQMMQGHGDAYSEYFNELRTPDLAILPFAWKNTVLRNSKSAIVGAFSQGQVIGLAR